MTIWLTADEHYWHKSIIDHCKRPFATIEEMNDELVLRHNTLVAPEDIVWHVGDFCWKASQVETMVSCLNGRHILIGGNHEKMFTLEQAVRRTGLFTRRGFVAVTHEIKLDIHGGQDYQTLVAHLPPVEFAGEDPRYLDERHKASEYEHFVCGHVHERWKRNGKCLNVGVDQWDFAPVDLDTVKKELLRGW